MAGFNLDDWLEEQARRNPQYMQRQPDMTFTPDEAENAPDMTIGLDEAQRGPAPFKPDMSFAPQWMETSQPSSRMSFLPEQTESPPSMDLTQDPEALDSPMFRQQMAQRSQPPAAGMPARGGPPMQNSLSSLLPQRDAEMDSRWRSAENTALDRSGYMGNQPYGAGEAVRDFAPMAVGGALDVLLNKGKGLGYLAGAGMQANAQTAATRQKEAQQAGDFAQAARQQREGHGLGAMRSAFEARQSAQFDLMNNPEHPAAKDRQAKLIEAGVPPELVQGASVAQMNAMQSAFLPYFKHDTAELSNTDAANRAQGVLAAQQGQRTEYHPTDLRQKTEIAGAEANARNASGLEYAGPTAVAREMGQAQGQNQAAPLTAATNQALGKVTERGARDEQFTTQFAKDNEAAIKAGTAVSNILKMSKDGQPPPGLDPVTRLGSKIPGATQLFPEKFSQEAQTVLQNLDFAEEAYSRDQSGAAIGVKEAAKFLRQVIGSPLASAQDVQAAIQRFGEQNNTYLRARASANPSAAGQALGAAGLDIGNGQQPSAAPLQPGVTAAPRPGGRTPPTTVRGPASPASPASPADGFEFQPSGMPDGSVYVIDKASGRRKRVSKETAAQLRGGM